jgi:hypothetical protein
MSIKVQHVDPIYIHQVWPEVERWLAPSFEKGKLGTYYNIHHLKDYIIRGDQTLLVGIKNDIIQGAVTIQWANHPLARVAYVTTFGAYAGEEVGQYTIFINWLKAMGATRIECGTRPSVARLLKQKMGFTPSNHISLELTL